MESETSQEKTLYSAYKLDKGFQTEQGFVFSFVTALGVSPDTSSKRMCVQ